LFIWSYALIGLMGGIISTAVMTLTEIPSWRRWGLHSVFEWHENQVLSSRFLRIFSYRTRNDDKNKTPIHFKGIFFLHFLNGILAGIAFPYIVYSVVSSLGVPDIVPIYLLGVLYGSVLWLLTLAPIHKPITGFSLWNHPLGHLPALVSFGGHLIYGIFLGAIVGTFMT
jgi:hypothetical protein